VRQAMRSASFTVEMASLALLLASCAMAYPGPGKTEAQLQHDAAYCESLAFSPQAILHNISVERCLVALGHVVKRADGTVISPPQPSPPQQPQTESTAGNGPTYIGPSTSPYMAHSAIDPVTVRPPSDVP